MMGKNFDFSLSEQYTLSIRLSTDGFSFSIYNPLNGSDFFFRSYPVNTQQSMAANVKAFLAGTEGLDLPYKQTNILVHSSRYTPVPLELFEDERMEDLFYQNLPRQNNEIVLCNVLGRSNLVILFSIDKLTHLFLSEHFPKARFFASVSPQLEGLATKSLQGNNRKLYAHLHPESIDVFCFGRGKLLLVNSYTTTTTEDRSYYLLNVWQQLGYSPNDDELHLTGRTPDRDALTGQLRKYLRKVFIIQPQADFNESVSSPIEDIPFDIQSLVTCE